MKTSVVEVGGMLSALSAHGGEKQLGKLPGVYSATVNYAAGSATGQCRHHDENPFRPHVATFWRNQMRKLWVVLVALVALSVPGCGYNTFQTGDEQIKASWSEVVNQYQRRADLIPNLVKTVQGFAAQEKEVLLGVTNARAKVGSIQATPELINNPEAFAKFQAAQGELSGALSRLLVVTENYPQLKSDANFRDLQAQLEGTENRIAVARNRYIKSVQEYNVTVRSFPSNLTAMAFGYKTKPNFTVENEAEISKAPKVDFGSAPVKPQGEAPGAAK
jgi:LemA protein